VSCELDTPDAENVNRGSGPPGAPLTLRTQPHQQQLLPASWSLSWLSLGVMITFYAKPTRSDTICFLVVALGLVRMLGSHFIIKKSSKYSNLDVARTWCPLFGCYPDPAWQYQETFRTAYDMGSNHSIVKLANVMGVLLCHSIVFPIQGSGVRKWRKMRGYTICNSSTSSGISVGSRLIFFILMNCYPILHKHPIPLLQERSSKNWTKSITKNIAFPTRCFMYMTSDSYSNKCPQNDLIQQF